MSSTNNHFMLEVKNLNKKFGEVHAVRNLNFQIKKGEIFGFLGPNGAGKSTTMRMITCYIPPSSGSIQVDGHDTLTEGLPVRKKIGYLPENNPLYNDMKVQEYLSFVGEIRGIKGSSLKKRIDELFTICGLNKMAQRQIGKLSKGYRQRVGLAQAMMHNPDLLILDEPMSGLDPNQIIEIRHLIKSLGQERQLSTVLISFQRLVRPVTVFLLSMRADSGYRYPDELTSRSNKGNRYLTRIKGDRVDIEGKLSSIPVQAGSGGQCRLRVGYRCSHSHTG